MSSLQPEGKMIVEYPRVRQMQEFTTRVSNLKRGTACIKYLKKVRGILASEPFHLSTLDICDHLFHTFLRVGHDLWSLVIRGFEEASEALK